MRVAIDAQLLPWRNGGVAHALLALLRAFARMDDGKDTYCLAVSTGEEEDYWRPHLSAGQELVNREGHQKLWVQAQYAAEKERVRQLTPPPAPPPKGWKPWRPLLNYARDVLATPSPPPPPPPLAYQPAWPEVTLSNGFYEGLGCDVLHFPWQTFELCAIPTVFSPHDLQHLHYPQFFTVQELVWRETRYPTGCRLAQAVIVGSEWVKDDVVRQYGIHPGKIQVIPEGPPNQVAPPAEEARVRQIREQYRLPESFLLYPAMTWPHKNHLRLLDALGTLRDERGLVVHLVLCGSQNTSFWPTIEGRIRELGLEAQVSCLGFIPEADLRIMQQIATALVQPSLFEASSLPIYDAWLDGVPVACARATALPEQVQDAAALFDPFDSGDMANVLASVVTDGSLRQDLRARGFHRLGDFDWERTAKSYRAVYRRAANAQLSEEDRWLLSGQGLHPGSRRVVVA